MALSLSAVHNQNQNTQKQKLERERVFLVRKRELELWEREEVFIGNKKINSYAIISKSNTDFRVLVSIELMTVTS